MKIRVRVCLIILLCGTTCSLPLAAADAFSDRQTGSVTNNSNAEVYLTFLSGTGEENSTAVMPNQTVSIPATTIEVQAELLEDVFEDETTTLNITMPDGSTHVLQSLPATVRIPGETPHAPSAGQPRESGLY